MLFGPDRFHPSADGYKQLASVLIPSCLAELGLISEDEVLPEAYRGEGVLPVAAAAARAVKTPGTELGGTEVSGAQRGLRGRWVELRHRRRHPSADAEEPHGPRSRRPARRSGNDAGPSSEDDGPAECGWISRRHA